MQDPETRAGLERAGESNQWVVGWVSCGVTSFMALLLIALDWRQRALLGKVAAGSFVAILVIVPITVLARLKKGKPVTAGWVFSLGYILLFLALQAFGPAAHMR